MGRQRGGEDEAAGKGADEVDEPGRAGDEAADDAEGLAERALDNVDAAHQALALGDTAAARAVHADGMDLVQIGQRTVPFGDVEDRGDRRDVAVHRIDALEGDDFRHVRAVFAKQPVEVGRVVVLPDPPLGLRVADALDHRGMVALVGEDHAAGQVGTER